jgi:DNA-directed RNA polymerase specialized sigma24 family protein
MGETVAKALYHFRTDVLLKKKWDYRKGASLRTYFVGQCLIRFANVYRRWLANEMRNRPPLRADETELLERDSKAKSPADEAADWAIAREALARVRDPRVRRAMILRAVGRSHGEIAIELEVTERAVERMLANQRDRFRRESA